MGDDGQLLDEHKMSVMLHQSSRVASRSHQTEFDGAINEVEDEVLCTDGEIITQEDKDQQQVQQTQAIRGSTYVDLLRGVIFHFVEIHVSGASAPLGLVRLQLICSSGAVFFPPYPDASSCTTLFVPHRTPSSETGRSHDRLIQCRRGLMSARHRATPPMYS